MLPGRIDLARTRGAAQHVGRRRQRDVPAECDRFEARIQGAGEFRGHVQMQIANVHRSAARRKRSQCRGRVSVAHANGERTPRERGRIDAPCERNARSPIGAGDNTFAIPPDAARIGQAQSLAGTGRERRIEQRGRREDNYGGCQHQRAEQKAQPPHFSMKR